jgi:hypothetical protein
MPTFGSDKERKKWQSLQNQAGASLTAIVHGRATSADFQRVTNVLNQQSSLAGQVFAQAVSAAEVQAKKFEAAYASVKQKDATETLTAFELALNDQLSKLAPNLLKDIREIVEMSVLQSNEDLTRTIGSKFSDLHDLLPKKELPSTDDVLAANDLLRDQLAEDDETRWKDREPRLIEKIAAVFETTLRTLADRINHERAAASGRAPAALPAPIPRLPAPAASPSLLDRAMPLLGNPSASRTSVPAPNAQADQSTAVVALNVRTQDVLTTAAKQETSLYQKLKDMLPAMPNRNTGGSQQNSDDEEKKADTWWRSFKNWFGDRKADLSKARKDNAGWLGALGKTLLLMILNPQLFKMLGDGIRKYLTWENLVDAAKSAWGWVADQASKVLDWVKNLLAPKEDTVSQASVDQVRKDQGGAAKLTPQAQKAQDNLTPAQKAQMAQWDAANKDHNPNAVATGTSPAGNSSWQSKIANFFGFKVGADTVHVAGTNISQTASSSNRTSITTPAASTTPSATSTSTESPTVSMRPGVATLPPGATPGIAAGTGDARPQRGAMQTGMSSYGFNATNSDSLSLMNTYHFTSG